MTRTVSLRGALAVGLTALATAGAVVAGAPSAQAATTTTCSLGITIINSPVIAFAGCVNFVDNGAPYVFNAANLSVNNFPFSPPLPPLSIYPNVVASCTGISSASGTMITATGCTYRR